MKFLIDAQLPRRFARILQSQGYEAYHTLDLPDQNRTTDRNITVFADDNDCIVTTKDSDFVDTFYLQHRPKKLWLISTGNITNQELEQIVIANLVQVVTLFQSHRFLELGSFWQSDNGDSTLSQEANELGGCHGSLRSHRRTVRAD